MGLGRVTAEATNDELPRSQLHNIDTIGHTDDEGDHVAGISAALRD